jgi:hypothetical protein
MLSRSVCLASVSLLFTLASVSQVAAQYRGAGVDIPSEPVFEDDVYGDDVYEEIYEGDILDDVSGDDIYDKVYNDDVYEDAYEAEVREELAGDKVYADTIWDGDIDAYDLSNNAYTLDYDYDYDYGRFDEPGDDVPDEDTIADNAFDYEGQYAYGDEDEPPFDAYTDFYEDDEGDAYGDVPLDDQLDDFSDPRVIDDDEYEYFYDLYGLYDEDADSGVFTDRFDADVFDRDYDFIANDYGTERDWYYTDDWYYEESDFDRWYE